MSREEAIEYFKLNINNLKRILDKRPGLKGSDLEKEIQACEKAIKALEQDSCEIIKEIPKDYCYDTETEDLLVYRNKYTGHEIHIEKPVPRYRLEQEPILDKIRAEIEAIEVNGQVDEHTMFIRAGEQIKRMALEILDKYKAESEET